MAKRKSKGPWPYDWPEPPSPVTWDWLDSFHKFLAEAPKPLGIYHEHDDDSYLDIDGAKALGLTLTPEEYRSVLRVQLAQIHHRVKKILDAYGATEYPYRVPKDAPKEVHHAVTAMGNLLQAAEDLKAQRWESLALTMLQLGQGCQILNVLPHEPDVVRGQQQRKNLAKGPKAKKRKTKPKVTLAELEAKMEEMRQAEKSPVVELAAKALHTSRSNAFKILATKKSTTGDCVD